MWVHRTSCELRSQGYKGLIYGFSNTGESLLAKQLGAPGAGAVLVRVTPRSDNAKSTLVRELLADSATALQEMNLGGFRVNFDGDRVGSKLVELSLIDGVGRVRE